MSITSVSQKKLAHDCLVSEMGAVFKPRPDARPFVLSLLLPDHCTHDFATLISSPIGLNSVRINVTAIYPRVHRGDHAVTMSHGQYLK